MKPLSTQPTNNQGFTFVEVMLVIVILGLVLTVGVPQIFNAFEKNPSIQTKNLTRLIRALRANAVLQQNSFYIVFDFKEQAYHVERVQKEGGRVELESPKWARRQKFPEDILLKQVLATAGDEQTSVLQYESLDVRNRPPAEVLIDSSGFISPFTLHFVEGDEQWRIRTRSIMGELEMLEGSGGVFDS